MTQSESIYPQVKAECSQPKQDTTTVAQAQLYCSHNGADYLLYMIQIRDQNYLPLMSPVHTKP